MLGPVYAAWIGPPALPTLFQRDGEQMTKSDAICMYVSPPTHVFPFSVKMHITFSQQFSVNC